MVTLGQRALQFWNHPAGPKTIHFWAPTFKWGISIANIADFQRPVDQVNYNLMTVNIFMAGTGLYQLYRRFVLGPAPPAIEEKAA